MLRLLLPLILFLIPLDLFCQEIYSDTTFYISQDFENRFFEEVETESNIQLYIQRENKGWLFFMLMLCSLIYATVKYAFPKEFDSSIKAFSNAKLAQQFFRDREIIQNFPAILMNIGFLLSVSILSYHFAVYLGMKIPISPPAFILMVALLCGLLIFLRVFTIRFIGWLYPLKHKTDYYSFNIMLANRINGLVLLPFLFIISFSKPAISEPFIIFSLVILLIFLMYKILRGYILAKEYFVFHKVHIILYICTFEISPVLLFSKVLAENLRIYFI